MKEQLKAVSPGKLILSGEHAVVYGMPAIAVAVDKYIETSCKPSDTDYLIFSSDTLGEHKYKLEDMAALRSTLEQRFNSFIQNKIRITELLEKPFDLLCYVLASSNIYKPLIIDISSSLPFGAGMGSSAAVIATLLKIKEKISGVSLSSYDFMKQVQYSERMQHGRGSMIDAATVTLGGIVKQNNTKIESLDINLDNSWYYFDTGTPANSTGEVVSFVRQYRKDKLLWQAFADVTQELSAVLSNPDSIINTIKENHKLLEKIGVVPESISRIILQIENLGGAAKICGAGAYSGTTAGQVLAYLPQGELKQISSEIGFRLIKLQQDNQGVHLV